ncbi:helix-turn-helix transcriptional regulator [uncultured Adlercreutzia sp.]|uniref:helix-turn-helix domain-containing protein n=1 Tax=uncultured Adlercreutzia sp. TaxID=875803 RepID=UPI0025E70571|nr:helix-turn-helix transcriptional regulator [uncultured Adlercreutzia sp.]
MDGEKLRELRESRGLTRRQVEDATGISQARVYEIERGNCPNPKLNTVRALAECYGTTVAEIIGEEE